MGCHRLSPKHVAHHLVLERGSGVTLSLSLSLCLCLFRSLSLTLCLGLSVCLSVCLCLSRSLSLSLARARRALSFSLAISLALSLALSLPVGRSLSPQNVPHRLSLFQHNKGRHCSRVKGFWVDEVRETGVTRLGGLLDGSPGNSVVAYLYHTIEV